MLKLGLEGTAKIPVHALIDAPGIMENRKM